MQMTDNIRDLRLDEESLGKNMSVASPRNFLIGRLSDFDWSFSVRLKVVDMDRVFPYSSNVHRLE